MRIISEKEINGRLLDGIGTLLKLDNKSFATVIKNLSAPADKYGNFKHITFYYLTDDCECPEGIAQLGLEDAYGGRGYFGGKYFNRAEIMQQIELLKLKITDKNSLAFSCCESLLKTSGIEALQRHYETNMNSTTVAQAIKALSSDEEMERFLSSSTDKQESLRIISDLFNSEILNSFYIKEISAWKEHFKIINNKENLDYFLPKYRTAGELGAMQGAMQDILKKEKWEINPKLRASIINDMPQNFSPEQKALYIYCKLVKESKFNQGYEYRDRKGVEEDFSGFFDKKRMESLTLESEMLCFDICRVFCKLAGEINGVTPVVVKQVGIFNEGVDEGHYRTGFYSNNVSVGLEPVNIISDGINDLYRAKNGLILDGINIVSDRKGLVGEALEIIYPLVFNKKLKTIEEHMAELKETIKPEIPAATDLKLQSFLEALRQHGIQGNEAVLALTATKKQGFWPDGLEFSFVGEQTMSKDGKPTRNRRVVINDKNQNQLYLFDPTAMTSGNITADQIKEGLQSSKLVYEKKEHQITLNDGGKLA